MNKNRYRIIYNKARQMFMAVAENAKSQSKASGQSTNSTTTSSEESFHQLWHVKALVASMSMWMPISSVYAGMVADTGAPAANRPVIGVGQNSQKQNVPVINIQTPNKSGVSHNIYKEFDVPTQGAVLNNSRTGAASSIVGSVGANPYLQTGEARLILNEVNSARASQFEGNLEIAGQRADLIIANPSGINVKGGGFINANRATLTTGKPQFNADGSIKQFVIDQGKITISANTGSQLGLGGANNNANYLDIYTRALELNAQLHAEQDIQVVTGANTISADLTQIQDKTSTAAAPTVAIDVKALGGMYANNIYLVGTDKGLGVNNAGTLQAVNNLVVTSAGKIEHTGAISSTSKTQGLVSVSTTGTGTAADINSAGTISSFGLLSLDSGNDINIKAKEVTLNYEGVASSPLIVSAKGNVNVADSAKIRNMGTTGDLYIDATNINLAANSELRSNRGSAHIQVQKDFTSNKAGLVAAKDLTVSANNHLNLTDTKLHASTGNIQLQSSSKETALNKITVQGGSVSAAKELAIYADKDITLNNIDFIKKANSSQAQVNSINAYAGNNLSFTTANQEFPYTAGKIQLGAGNQLRLEGKDQNSKLSGGGGLKLSGKNISTKNIYMTGSGANGVDIISDGGNILLDQGSRLWANTGNINVNALNGSITANSLQATTLGKASILASKNVILAANKVETAVTGTDAKNITYTPSKISADKGIQIASIDNGYLRLNTINLDAKNGDIQLDAKGNISLVRSDVITQHQNADGSFSPKTTYLWSGLNGNNILINSGANNSLNWGNFTAIGNIQAQAKGTQFLYGMNLKSGANTTLHADGRQTLHYVTAQSAGHTALSTKDRLHLSSSIVAADGTTNWGVGNTVKLQADGVLSLVSGAGQYLQNTDIKGGAVLIESGAGFDVNKNVKVTATGSPLLNNDKDLNKLNGNLSIQTNDNLTIDPKLLTLSAVGNYDLMSKKGDLTLIGHGGTKGNGSEQVVKLNTANGGINLTGQKVELQGSQLNAVKDISIVSTGGDLIVDSVKNRINNLFKARSYDGLAEELQQIELEKKKLKTEEYKKDYLLLVQSDDKSIELFSKFWNNPKDQPNPYYSLWREASDKFSNDYEKFMAKYAVKLNYPLYGQPNFRDILHGSIMPVDHVFGFKYSDEYINELKSDVSFYKSNLNGYEHQGATLTSNTGNINLVSKQGLSISGTTIDAKKGSVLIEAAGTLANEEYQIQGEFQSNIKNSVKQGQIKGSIIIDATQDSYEIGQVTDENYNWRSPVNATMINGDKGVKIKTVGKSATDNLILQGVGITSNNGNVDIEAYKNIIFDVAVENSYDKSKKTETKRKWYGKKKTTTTIKTAERVGGLSVDIDAKNINITSEEAKKADDKETGLHRTSIDMYSSQLTAHGGKVKILAGGDINLLTADNVSKDTLDISKSSSWAGIKLNKSKYTSTRNIKSELPAVLEASYIGAQADGSIILKGTEFNYLEGAEIKAGEKITLLGASDLVEETLNKTSNSVVWQSMQDKGSITETAKLPTFNGPVAPKFVGSLTVQVPVAKRTANQKELIAEIEKLAKTPGNSYLQGLIDNKDQKVNWEQVLLTNENWDYKSQGLTAAGAAILAIAIAAATGGAGVGAILSTGGTVTNAALLSLTTQASISLINNGGDLSATFKELGSKDSVKSLAITVVTAGLVEGLSTSLKIDLNGFPTAEKIANNFVQGVGSNLISSTLQGESLSDSLEKALLAGVTNALQAEMATKIGTHLDKIDPSAWEYALHKIAHAAAGCVAAAVQKECEAGAIGASVAEVVAGLFDKPSSTATQEEKDAFRKKVVGTTKLVSGVVAAYSGYDVNIAASSAENAVTNNYLTADQWKELNQKLSSKCKTQGVCTDGEKKIYNEFLVKSQANDEALLQACSSNVITANCTLKLKEVYEGQITKEGLKIYTNIANRNNMNQYGIVVNSAPYIQNEFEKIKYQDSIRNWVTNNCNSLSASACGQLYQERKQKDAALLVAMWEITPVGNVVSISQDITTLFTGKDLTGAEADKIAAVLGIATLGMDRKVEIIRGVGSKILVQVEKTIPTSPLKNMCSFRGDMEVKTSKGYRPIQSITQGDWVYSLDEVSGKYSYKQVLAQYYNPYKETVYLTIKNQTGTEQTIVSNKIHPFFTIPREITFSSEGHIYKGAIAGGQWVDAANLQEGNRLLDSNNKWQEVVSVIIKPESLRAYNLTVDQTHTYFIKGLENSDGVNGILKLTPFTLQMAK
ncbi:polymorphic toxin-type HINT domain-containing protein [Acinetobacter haemolyticus]|uniref:two-partner secretion domain-containing protein n=1 Tax=Acinetobacter haemolyticus TaxID=29430 RepID=UPI00094940C3|nr:polymorphic toxin-type HINT domain-containing protein [Acinetobacter haemolyticus]APR70928.1 hemagglutinin [Acinetobacter haemolyticus]